MDLTHRFTVPAPLDHAWRSFNDLESIAPCFPGATLTTVEGDEFTGSVKVKFGPIAMVYTGTGTFTERDENAHRAVIEAKGKDKRGNGTANATVTATFRSEGESSTAVEVVTDLSVTGKPAQFGRGVISDISDKLLGQFVDCISARFAAGQVPVGGSDGSDESSGESGGSAGSAATSNPLPTHQPHEPEPVATGLGPIGGGAQSGGVSGVTPTSSGSSVPPTTVEEPEARHWTPPSSGGSSGSGGSASQPAEINALATALPVLAKRFGPPVLAGLTFVGLVITIIRKLRAR